MEGPGNCVPWEHTTAPASKCLSGAFGVAFILMSEPAHGGLSQEPSCAGWETHLVTPEAGWRGCSLGDMDACGRWGGSGPEPGEDRGATGWHPDEPRGPWDMGLPPAVVPDRPRRGQDGRRDGVGAQDPVTCSLLLIGSGVC